MATKLERTLLHLEATASRLPITVEVGPLTVTVSKVWRDGETLWVDVAAQVTATGRPVTLNGPYGYVNPPTLVPDDQGNIELRGARFAYSPLRAFRQMIADTLRRDLDSRFKVG